MKTKRMRYALALALAAINVRSRAVAGGQRRCLSQSTISHAPSPICILAAS